MDTKANAYAVLELCQNDPNYSNETLKTDVAGHILEHMGLTEWPTWRPLMEHIGFDDDTGRDLWDLLNEEELPKESALHQFELMIEKVHGTNGGFSIATRLL